MRNRDSARSGWHFRRTLLLVPLLWTHRAYAHAWGNSYSLPIPFEMYAYGATAALIISFVLVGYFAQASGTASGDVPLPNGTECEPTPGAGSSRLIALLRAASVLGWGLTVATGLFGNPSPFANFSMTFFWVIFVLGFAYFTALSGDLYALLNPWKILCDWIEGLWPQAFATRKLYPDWAGYWPAIVLYGAFLWIELFGHSGPRFLAIALLAYTAITFLGAGTFGKQDWFRFGEFFGVFLHLISRLAPFERVVVQGRARLRLRRPFEALTRASASHLSLALFILFMLSSTAFDGAHETLPWVNIFWRQIFPHLQPLIARVGLQSYDVATDLYYAWQQFMLVLSPFLYFGIYWLFMCATKLVTRTELPVGQLARCFALSLVPIAFVYHAAHYFGLLLTEGPNIVALASDPFGIGWNLLGTAGKDLSIIPPAGVVWHTQVWLILAGHIISVYVAHVQALRVFPGRAQAVRSQLPMLLLMVILTSLGLWILSLPIAAGQVSAPGSPMG
jgi:hypothetical protein